MTQMQPPPAPPVRPLVQVTPGNRVPLNPAQFKETAGGDPIFVNEQNSPVTVFSPDKKPIDVMPLFLAGKTPQGVYHVQGEHYAQFAEGRGGLSRFRPDIATKEMGDRILTMVAARGNLSSGVTAQLAQTEKRASKNVILDENSALAVMQATKGASIEDVTAITDFIALRRTNPHNANLHPAVDLRYGAVARCIADSLQKPVAAIQTHETVVEAPKAPVEEKAPENASGKPSKAR